MTEYLACCIEAFVNTFHNKEPRELDFRDIYAKAMKFGNKPNEFRVILVVGDDDLNTFLRAHQLAIALSMIRPYLPDYEPLDFYVFKGGIRIDDVLFRKYIVLY